MIGKSGALLTPEQSVRLAMVNSIDRQKLIETIAAHLRRAAKLANMGKGSGGSLRDLYRVHVKG